MSYHKCMRCGATDKFTQLIHAVVNGYITDKDYVCDDCFDELQRLGYGPRRYRTIEKEELKK